MYFLE